MEKLTKVIYGSRSVEIPVEGKTIAEVKTLLEQLHDTCVPENVEVYVDKEKETDMEVELGSDVTSIEFTAVAGEKGN